MCGAQVNSKNFGSPLVWCSALFIVLVAAAYTHGIYIMAANPVGGADQAAVSTAYATWALFVVTSLLVFGIALARRQLMADHERSRRELALRLAAEWVNNQCDREMIEEEFMPLIIPQEGDLHAERFRQGAQNENAWPATKAFVEEWRKRNQSESIARPVVT